MVLGKKAKKNQNLRQKKQKLFYTPVEICGLENEQCLTALVLQPKVTTTSAAMALRCVGGDGVVTWGERFVGADSSVNSKISSEVSSKCAVRRLHLLRSSRTHL
jgi:hypothetical protein